MADTYENPLFSVEPLLLDEKVRSEILDYVVAEDETASQERGPLEERVTKWRRQREQEPESQTKNSPWPGASNVATPLAAMATNGNYSFLRQAFALRNPFWTIGSPMDQMYIDAAADMTDLFKWLSISPYHLNLNENLETILYTAASEGNCFVKIPWLIENWQFKGTDENGNVLQINKTMRDGPAIIPVPFEDFITRAGVHDIQEAPWLRHRIYLFWHQLKNREANLIYTNVDDLADKYISRYDEMKEEEMARAGLDPKETKLWDIREYHVFWDVDGDGIPEDFIITINWDTKTVLREQFNDLGIRPWVNVPYEVRPNQLYKMGVGARSERLQDEVDTHRNYRVDAMVLANLRMVVARRSAGISPKEKLYPGKILFADNPRDDITTLQFGEVYNSSLEAEASAVNYLRQITNLSPYDLGFNDPNVNRPTTSGMMYLGQQGGTVRGSVIEAMQNAFSKMGQIILFQLVRNNTRLNLQGFNAEKAASIQEILKMKVEDIPTRFQFTVKTTDINRTEEAKRQNLLTLTQLYAAYYKDITATMMQAFSPLPPAGPNMPPQQLPPVVKTLLLRHFTGASRMMSKVLKYFGEEETDQYLPNFRKMEMLLNALDRQQGGQLGQSMGAGQGGSPEAGNAFGGAGMGGGAPAEGAAPSGVQQPGVAEQGTMGGG